PDDTIRITEVSPRDGLQNEATPIPTADKAKLVRLLSRSGVDEVEVSSFVSPKWVPQLGDAQELFAAVADMKPEGLIFSALVPNAKGLEGALAVNETIQARLIDKISVFTAASETFSKKNTNAGIAETIERFREVVSGAKEEQLALRGYISCAIECPFEGPIEPGRVAEVVDRLLELGIEEIDLGDTIGKGTPKTMAALLEAVQTRIEATPGAWLTVHLHDTFGGASACVKTALDMGVRSFDGSAAGLGGCPYAATESGGRAPGNISTESLMRAITDAGYTTKIDAQAMNEASEFAAGLIAPREPEGGTA
ncbi:MAG: hydroxymethylglutaryl-CoA lyase, partial [Phycisphaerales bacterium]